MAKQPCIFHAQCSGISGTSEHLLQAALGGLREDGRILCATCQPLFSEGLDRVLPRELRHFNTILGIKSRHRGVVPPAPVTDTQTGLRFWIDEDQAIVRAEPALKQATVDDQGLEQRYYTIVGDRASLKDFDEAAFLKRLEETEGKRFKLVERTSTRPVLIARPMMGDSSFGGDESFRAVARIALNFLAADDPLLARAPGLEPLKQWIREGTPAGEFANFADPIDEADLLPNSFELGHRVALGFCARTQTISARVTLFGVHEVAVKLGSAPCTRSCIAIVDIDPKARRQEPGLDTRQFAAVSALAPSTLGEFARDPEAVVQRNRTRTQELRAAASERLFGARFTPLVDRLNAARGLLRFQQVQKIRRILDGEQQNAFNLLVPAVRAATQFLEEEGYVQHAQHLSSVIESEDGDVVVGQLGTLLAQQVLSAIGSDFLDAMAQGPITLEIARDLLAGPRGLRAAFKVVTEACVMMGLPMV